MRRAIIPHWPQGALLLGLMALTLCIPRESVAQRPQMELLETKLSVTQDTINLAGQVKNISPREVSGVTVFCDFQNSSGKSVQVLQGHLDTDPLPPNKISEFKISTKYNPEIKRFNVTFGEMFGGRLVTKDSRKQ